MQGIVKELCSFYLILRVVMMQIVQSHGDIMRRLIDHARDSRDFEVVVVINQASIESLMLLNCV